MAEDDKPRCSCGSKLLLLEEDGWCRVCPHCDTVDPAGPCPRPCRQCQRLRKAV